MVNTVGKKLATYLLLAFITTAIITNFSSAQISPLKITVTTDKTSYRYREAVNIYGNVTYNDQLVEEGLVAVQIDNPDNKTIALRTVPANATPTENWTVEILSFISCDSSGNPQDTFQRNKYAYFKIFIKNNAVVGDRSVLLTITLCDFDSTPFRLHWLKTVIPAGQTHGEIVGLWINEWITTGTAVAYANVYTDWPKHEGYAYCPEQTANFFIETTTPLNQTPIESNDTYTVTFRLPPHEAPYFGTYFISTSAYYKGWKNFQNTTLTVEYQILGDFNYDRRIDILDVVMLTSIYGSTSSSINWNPELDVSPDGKIDILDVVMVTSKYGFSY
ncbi:hypothetical protein IBX35_02905 [Candidatus Bathyarchaeota archaeon]|nr:hypothetical protein [Candidatus Bathyarchaeota archaeon]